MTKSLCFASLFLLSGGLFPSCLADHTLPYSTEESSMIDGDNAILSSEDSDTGLSSEPETEQQPLQADRDSINKNTYSAALLSYDGADVTVSYYAKNFGSPNEIYPDLDWALYYPMAYDQGYIWGNATIVRDLGEGRGFYANEDQCRFIGQATGLRALSNGKRLSFYSGYTTIDQDEVDVDTPISFPLLYNTDMALSDTQIEFDFESLQVSGDVFFLGLTYHSQSNQYILAYADPAKYSNEADSVKLLLFNDDCEYIAGPVSVEGTEIYTPRTPMAPSYTLYEIDDLIIGCRSLSSKVNSGNFIFNPHSMEYQMLDDKDVETFFSNNEKYTYINDERITRQYTSGVIKMLSPPFSIKNSATQEHIEIVLDDSGEILSQLPNDYYLVDLEANNDGFTALFAFDYGDGLANCLLPLHQWDERDSIIR